MTDRAHLNRVILDSTGNVQGVPLTISVYQPGTTTAITDTIFLDNTTGSTKTNPFTTGNGIVDFYLPKAQRVDLKVDNGITATTYSNVDVLVPGLNESVNTVAASGAAQTLVAPSVATMHRITLTANCAITFPTPAAGASLSVFLTQDATGSRTVTWDAAVKWAGGTAPTLTTAATKTDVFRFFCPDGVKWYGVTSGLNY